MLITTDGVRPDAWEAAGCSNHAELVRTGSATMSARCVLPSITLPNHISMLFGVIHRYTECAATRATVSPTCPACSTSWPRSTSDLPCSTDGRHCDGWIQPTRWSTTALRTSSTTRRQTC
ncbi:MAG: alkaline phosphatase family protein [Acidobacteria bacterium]|nr:alkaline phosphatase family protein [Acidobacteriota bacterium]